MDRNQPIQSQLANWGTKFGIYLLQTKRSATRTNISGATDPGHFIYTSCNSFVYKYTMLSLGRFFRGGTPAHAVCSHVDQVLRSTRAHHPSGHPFTATSSALYPCFPPNALSSFRRGTGDISCRFFMLTRAHQLIFRVLQNARLR
jgi:hypothetical protein